MERTVFNYPAGSLRKVPPHIMLTTCNGMMIIPVQQIIRIQSISNYSKLFFRNASPATGGRKTIVMAKVLRWFQNHPALSSFVRIHRGHLINIEYINSYYGGHSGILCLHNGEKLIVARRKKAAVIEVLSRRIHIVPCETSLFQIKKTIKLIA